MVTCDKFKHSRIQCLFYFAANDQQLWTTYRTMVKMPIDAAAPRST